MKNSWHPESSIDIQYKIDVCSKALFEWGQHLTASFKNRLAECKNEMYRLRGIGDVASKLKLQATSEEYILILSQQETFWKQRAKQHWLLYSDTNSRYFHAAASSRKNRNSFNQLQDNNGSWYTWGNGLEHLIGDYFSVLFSSRGGDPTAVLNLIGPKVSSDQNSALDMPFTEDEIKRALFSMHHDKSPGPDGMNPAFFQSFWHTVGGDVARSCLYFLENCMFPPGFNDTTIVLIPKKDGPEFITDMRPIALCNVIYKVAAKTIANRLKTVLSSIIDVSQSAFIGDRMITDNILIATEVNHFLKRKRQGKTSIVALKVDLSKAYDCMEWNFLKRMMSRLGFSSKFFNLVMLCVSTIRYKIVASGDHKIGPIIPTRGLHQGDPLSQYLYVICVEGLSTLIRDCESRGTIHGCRVAQGALTISLIFFTDDSFFFFSCYRGGMHHYQRLFFLARICFWSIAQL